MEPAIPEQFAFKPTADLSARSDSEDEGNLPFRHLRNVVIYNRRGEMVGLEAIEREGPFTATGFPAPEEPDVVDEYRGRMVLLEDIIEYSLEYPYGKDAVVWLNTARAYYAIDSLLPNYRARKGDIFRVASLCGHVINALINIRGERSFARVMLKARWLSGMPLVNFVEGIARRRHFLMRQLDQQQISYLRQTRFFKILNESAQWTEAGIKELIEQIEREARRQEKTHDLDSSDEESSEPDKPKPTKKPAEPKKKKVSENAAASRATAREDSEKENANSNTSGNQMVMDVERTPKPTEPTPIDMPLNEERESSTAFSMQESRYQVSLVLPSRLALRYQCPFCSLMLLRVHEEVDIVEVTRQHLQDHLRLKQAGRWIAPPRTAPSVPWPPLTPDNAANPAVVPFLLPVPAASGTFDISKARLPMFIESDDEDEKLCKVRRDRGSEDLAPVTHLFTLLGSPRVSMPGRHSSVPIVIED